MQERTEAKRVNEETDSAQPIRLVCFDLGGVVVRICRTWSEAVERAGVTVVLEREPDLDDPQWVQAVIAHQTGRFTGTQFFTQIARLLGGCVSVDDVRRIHMAWTGESYPGVDALIDELHAGGIETAALSNTNNEHWELVSHQAPIPSMGAHFVSHEMGLHKPDAAIYRAVEQASGLSRDAIMFFDDTLENIEAARALGWRAVHIDHRSDTAAQMSQALAEASVSLVM